MKQDRANKFKQAEAEVFDLIIIGGGIHGASICRDAALRGYRVLLLEARDYAFGTSSRSSKMLHGGVRYLEQGNLRLVAEALAERVFIKNAAPHLVREERFLFPILPKLTRPSWQIGLGLFLYQTLAEMLTGRKKFRESGFFEERIRATAEDSRKLRELGLTFSELFQYRDGQMDDLRLVIENILDAENLAALTLNYARVNKVIRLRGGGLPAPYRINSEPMWELYAQDTLTQTAFVCRSRYLVNATGPWTPQTHSLYSNWASNLPKPRYSRGTHLLFSKNLETPALILPSGQKGRYYFVLPFFSPFQSGTLVGTSDQETKNNENDPLASAEEIGELLGFLARDIPQSGLNESTLYKSFAGMRILAGSEIEYSKISSVSRREILIVEDGYLAFLGGKYTTSRLTAERFMNHIDRYFGRENLTRKSQESTRNRPFPGGVNWNEENFYLLTNKLERRILETISAESPAFQIHKKNLSTLAKQAVKRFGSRAINLLKYVSADDGKFLSHDSIFLPAEVRLVIEEEQAQNTADVVRRLGLDLHPEVTRARELIELLSNSSCFPHSSLK